MSEIFTVTVKNIAVTAAQDILAIYVGTTKKVQLLAVEIAATGQTTVGNYPISIRYLPATVTAGSAGAAVTPVNVNSLGAAVVATARRNDTTRATTSGTAVEISDSVFNPINGYYWQPPVPVGEEPIATMSTAFVIGLDAAPAASINVSATAWFREI
jgi:hypothetical protein